MKVEIITLNLRIELKMYTCKEIVYQPFKDEAQTGIFKDPVRTAL